MKLKELAGCEECDTVYRRTPLAYGKELIAYAAVLNSIGTPNLFDTVGFNLNGINCIYYCQ